MTPSRNVVAVTDETVREKVARAICKARGRNPDDCVMGSGSVMYGGGGTFECHRHAWEDELGAATAALAAAYPSMVAEVERLTKALGAIARADPIDLALDPEWPQRVARAALTEAKTP